MWSQWDGYLLVWWSVVPGVVLMNLIDWKNLYCQQFLLKFRRFKMLWRIIELYVNCLARRYRICWEFKEWNSVYKTFHYLYSGKYSVFISPGTPVSVVSVSNLFTCELSLRCFILFGFRFPCSSSDFQYWIIQL